MQPLLLILLEFVFSAELIQRFLARAFQVLQYLGPQHHEFIFSRSVCLGASLSMVKTSPSYHPVIHPPIRLPTYPLTQSTHTSVHPPTTHHLSICYLSILTYLLTCPQTRQATYHPSIHASIHPSIYPPDQLTVTIYLPPALQSLYGIQTWTRRAGFLSHVVKSVPGEIRKWNHNLWPKVVCVIWVLWQVIRVHRWASGIWNSVDDKVCMVSVYIHVHFQGRGSMALTTFSKRVPRKH